MSEEFREPTGPDLSLAAVERARFMPAMSIELAVERYGAVTEFVSRVLRRDVDYGVIPGTEKRTLLKPGAEKLTTFFGLSTRFQLLERIEDWTGERHGGEPFFYYLYRCQLYRGDLLIAEADGSCNSRESKYRWREAQRVCPACAQAAIIKGKEDFGGGWLCLSPDTPILYADFVWRPIGEAKPGDVILGFDEYPAGYNVPRKFRHAIIEDVWASRQQTYRLITEGSEIITTGGHRWLRHLPSNGLHWMPTERLEVGRAIRSVGANANPPVTDEYRMGYLAGMTLGDGTMRYTPGQTSTVPSKAYWRVALKQSDEAALGRLVAYLAALGIEARTGPFCSNRQYPDSVMKRVAIYSVEKLSRLHALVQPKDSREFKRGFLAGFFDAEGSGHESHLRVYQNDVAVLETFRRYAAELGFSFEIYARDGDCSSARLRGTMLDRLRFLTTVQPALTRKSGLLGTSMRHAASPILALERGPTRDLIDIQTSTGTFFAAGLATHNCWRKKGGCGAKFRDGDEHIESQQTGRVFNPDLADQVNTIQKMSQKRSLVAAVLLAVNASEFFTQDVEDLHGPPAGAAHASGVTNAPPAPDPDAEIRAACRALGKSEGQLNVWINKKFGAGGVEHLTPADKSEVLSLLRGMLTKQAAA